MKEKTLKIYRQPSVDSYYPEIRLSGKWILRLGFKVGDYIRIIYGKQKIKIRKIETANQD